MDTSKLPPASGGSLETLIGLLADRGVSLRVIDGRLQLHDTDHRLHDVDRGVVRHYKAELVAYLVAGACPDCGAVLHEDRIVYRTDDDGDILGRCCGCGCTWLWIDPQDVRLPGRGADTTITSSTENSI